MEPTRPRKIRLPIALKLSPGDRASLEELTSVGRSSARIFKRARILQLLDQGHPSGFVQAATGASQPLVQRVGLRYLKTGLEAALFEKPRPGAQRRLDAAQEARVVAMVCSPPPEGFARWTVRLIAREAVRRKLVESVGRETIRELLLNRDLKPWREKKVLHPGDHAGVPGADGGRPGPVREAAQSEGAGGLL